MTEKCWKSINKLKPLQGKDLRFHLSECLPHFFLLAQYSCVLFMQLKPTQASLAKLNDKQKPEKAAASEIFSLSADYADLNKDNSV